MNITKKIISERYVIRCSKEDQMRMPLHNGAMTIYLNTYDKEVDTSLDTLAKAKMSKEQHDSICKGTHTILRVTNAIDFEPVN